MIVLSLPLLIQQVTQPPKTITIAVSKGDNQAPSISSFTVDDNTVVVSTSSQYQTVTFSVTATDNVAVTSVSIPGATYVSTSGNTRTFEKTFEYSQESFGVVTQNFTATVSDAAGNTDSESLVITVTNLTIRIHQSAHSQYRTILLY